MYRSRFSVEVLFFTWLLKRSNEQNATEQSQGICVWERKRHRVHNHMEHSNKLCVIEPANEFSVKWNDGEWVSVQMDEYHHMAKICCERTTKAIRLTHFVWTHVW